MRLPVLVLLSSLCGTVNAQDRRPCIGTLLDTVGQPIVEAIVTCVYASPGDPSFLHDEQSTTTDARGRFRLSLWNGVSYAIWAVGPGDDSGEGDGARAVTGLHQGATGGGYLELVARGRQQPRKLTIVGLEPWLEHGAARLTLHRGGKDLLGTQLTLPAEGGVCALPPTPMAELTVVVGDADGAPLVLAQLPAGPDPHVVLPAPEERVVQVDAGAALPEGTRVRVYQRMPEPWDCGELFVPVERFVWRDGPEFDTDRRCRIVLPELRPDPDGRWFHGRAVVACAGTAFVAEASIASATRELEFFKDRLGGGGEIRLMRASTSKLPASLVAMPMATPHPGQSEWLVIPRRAQQASWFEIELPRNVTTASLRAGLACADCWAGFDVFRRSAGGEPGPALQHVAFAPSRAGSEDAVAPAFGREAVQVTVRDAEAGPARLAWVCIRLLDEPCFSGFSDEQRWLRADSGGRVSERLPAGSYGVHATDGTSLGFARLVVRAGERADLHLDLERLPTMSCRVLAGGAPAAGVRVFSMAHGTQPKGLDALDQQHFQVAQSLAYRLAVRPTTDANGEITLPVIPLVSSGAEFSFRLAGGGKTAEVAMQPGKEFVEVR